MLPTKKITKSFNTKPDVYGFTNEIEISANYDPEIDFIMDLKVMVFSGRKQVFIDVTDIFNCNLDSFTDIIDNIPWREMYRDLEQPDLFDQACKIVRDDAKERYNIEL